MSVNRSHQSNLDLNAQHCDRIQLLIFLRVKVNLIVPEPTARSAVPGVSPGRGLLISL